MKQSQDDGKDGGLEKLGFKHFLPPGTHMAIGFHLWDAPLCFDPWSFEQLTEKSNFLGRLIM